MINQHKSWYDEEWWLDRTLLNQTQFNKEMVIRGFNSLKQLFNDEWLEKQNNGRAKSHPITFFLVARGLYPFLFLAKLGNAIADISSSLKAEKVLDRFLIPSEYDTTISVINAGSFFVNNGYTIEFDFNVRSTEKVPDILVNKNNDAFLVEVKKIGQSQGQNIFNDFAFYLTSRGIFKSIISQKKQYTIQIKEEFLEKLNLMKEHRQAFIDDAFKKIEDGLLGLSENPDFEGEKEISNIASIKLEKYGTGNGISGSSYSHARENSRIIKNAFDEAVVQLSNSDIHGLIWIDLPPIPRNIENIKSDLEIIFEKEGSRHKDIIGVFFVSNIINGFENKEFFSFVKNPNFKFDKDYFRQFKGNTWFL